MISNQRRPQDASQQEISTAVPEEEPDPEAGWRGPSPVDDGVRAVGLRRLYVPSKGYFLPPSRPTRPSIHPTGDDDTCADTAHDPIDPSRRQPHEAAQPPEPEPVSDASCYSRKDGSRCSVPGSSSSAVKEVRCFVSVRLGGLSEGRNLLKTGANSVQISAGKMTASFQSSLFYKLVSPLDIHVPLCDYMSSLHSSCGIVCRSPGMCPIRGQESTAAARLQQS